MDATSLASTTTSASDVLDGPFSERHRTVVDAPVGRTWQACLDVTTREIRAFAPLIALRTAPSRWVRRRDRASTPASERLIDTFEREGFVPLRRDEQPHEGTATLVMGAAGRFWSPSGNAPVRFDHADELIGFDRPGHALTVFSVVATADGPDRTRVVTETVVDGTDPAARRRFAAYWALIRLPSGLIRRSWLAAIRRRAERAT